MSDIGDSYRLEADVPGARKEDVDVAPGPVPGTLLVRVRHREDGRPRSMLHAERSTAEGRSERIIPVAWDADVSRASVEVENGVLRVKVPKQRLGERQRPETR